MSRCRGRPPVETAALLLLADVLYYDPAIGQCKCTSYAVKQLRLFSIERPDRNRRFRADLPSKPGIRRRAGIPDDANPGAVLNHGMSGKRLGVGRRAVPTVFTCDRGYDDDRRGNRD